ncbi:MAG: hypothetical protein ACXU93_02190 [Thermodesulfobacteriota bacterium]
MERRDCFGSIKEVTVDVCRTLTHARPECRNCEEIRDCLRTSKQIEEERKERDELRKQDLIAQIIDHSHIISNEIGACLLEFLSRIYSSPIGMILFRNLLLFYEVPRDSTSYHLNIPISRTTMNLIQGEGNKGERTSLEGFTLRIVLFKQSFPNHPKANMGMIAYEVAHTFSSDPSATNQIFKMLSDAETNFLKKMDVEARTKWLVQKWGFAEDLEAFEKQMSAAKLKDQLDESIKK